MRMQSSQANCGSTALYNAACALGKTVSLEECERVCSVSATDGTPTKNLLRGVQAIGLRLVLEIKETREDVALLRLGAALHNGHAAILVVDSDSHWAAAVGSLGARVLVADSAESELVLSLSEGELGKRWVNQQSRKHFYAVVVGLK